jgi:hypothetical protein
VAVIIETVSRKFSTSMTPKSNLEFGFSNKLIFDLEVLAAEHGRILDFKAVHKNWRSWLAAV